MIKGCYHLRPGHSSLGGINPATTRSSANSPPREPQITPSGELGQPRTPQEPGSSFVFDQVERPGWLARCQVQDGVQNSWQCQRPEPADTLIPTSRPTTSTKQSGRHNRSLCQDNRDGWPVLRQVHQSTSSRSLTPRGALVGLKLQPFPVLLDVDHDRLPRLAAHSQQPNLGQANNTGAHTR